MRLRQPSRRFDLSEEFDHAYPILAAVRRSNSRLGAECESVWRVFDEFSRVAVEPVALELDRVGLANPGQSLAPILSEACKHRVFSMSLPRSLGGQGVSMLAFTVGLERLATSCLGVANLVAVHGLGLGLMGAVGALSNLRQVATNIIEGERRCMPYLLSTAATEPAAGTDMEDSDLLALANLECEGVSVPGGWQLNGTKVFVSNGSLASAFVIVAPLDRANPVETLSAFLVERDRSGLQITRVEHKLGQRACPAAEIRLTNCVVPIANKLNHRTLAGKSMDMVLGSSRGTVAAFGAGAAWGVLHDCIEFIRKSDTRGSFPVGHEASEAILSQMWQNARLARCSYLEAILANSSFGLVSLMEVPLLRQLDRVVPPGIGAWASSLGVLDSSILNREARRWLDQLSANGVAMASAHASAAKIACSRLALQNSELASELLGPWSPLESTGLPKRWRDARLLAIYEGTNELNAHDVYKHAVAHELTRGHE